MANDIKRLKQQYSIKDFCDYASIVYKIASNGDLLIKSPANPQQKTESLRVRANYQGEYRYFKDFGNGRYGDLLNFAEYYYGKSTKEAIELLKAVLGEQSRIKPPTSQSQVATRPRQSAAIEIEKIQPLQNHTLIDYLAKRGIDLGTAKKAGMKEAYYKIGNKKYFAIAFENDQDGVEMRNPYFKGAIGQKDITTILAKNSTELNIYEGFIDFATAVKISKGKVLDQNNIILNSVALVDRAIEWIKKEPGIKKIKLYLDNDKAGQEAARQIVRQLGSKKEVVDMSNYYHNFNDLNDFLINKKKEQELER